MTPAAALRLLEQAEQTHIRAHWRLAARALGEVVAALQDAQPVYPAPVYTVEPEPPRVGVGGAMGAAAASEPRRSLIAFLADHGVRDPGGELRAADLDTWHRARPFRRRLVRDDGAYTVESAAEAAWEAGFFDQVPWPADARRCPVTDDMLIAAIEREARGDFKRLYPQECDA